MGSRRIVNASPLIFLSRVNLLEILRLGTSKVVVPDRVVGEIHRRGPSDRTVQALAQADWILVEPCPTIPAGIARWELGAGESSVLTLALEDDESEVVLDDGQARRCAAFFRISTFGTLGLLLIAKKAGVIPEVRPILLDLVSSGMYLSRDVIERALATVGETL